MIVNRKGANRMFRGLHGQRQACCETCADADLAATVPSTTSQTMPIFDPGAQIIPGSQALTQNSNQPALDSGPDLAQQAMDQIDAMASSQDAQIVSAAVDATVRGSPLPLAGAIGGLLWKGPLWGIIGGIAGYLLSRPKVGIVLTPNGPAISIPPAVAVNVDSIANTTGVAPNPANVIVQP